MRHRFDVYGHRLRDVNDAELEDKVNRLAEEFARAYKAEGKTDRTRGMRAELILQCTEYFRVVGQGMSDEGRTFDDVLLSLLEETLKYESDKGSLFDPDKGEYTHWLRYLFKRRRVSAGNKEDKETPVVSTDAPASDAEDKGETIGDGIPDSSIPDFLDDYRTEKLYIEFLTLGMQLRDLVGSSTDGDGVAHVGRHMAFTETVTSIVRDTDGTSFSYLNIHERDTFKAIETAFLDSYMMSICRTIYAIWATDIVEGYRSRTRNNLLNTKAYIDYLHNCYGQQVTAARVSQFRKELENMFGVATFVRS